MICYEKLANGSLKPSLLRRHLETQHGHLKEKPRDYFQRRKCEMKNEIKTMASVTGINSQALEASYLVSLRIAKTGKPHTIGETLILPAAKDIVSSILGEEAAKKLNVLSLSDNIVSRRIQEMSDQVKENLLENVKKSKFFSLQLDESTDVANFAQLMTYIRYEIGDTIKEEFLFCESHNGS